MKKKLQPHPKISIFNIGIILYFYLFSYTSFAVQFFLRVRKFFELKQCIDKYFERLYTFHMQQSYLTHGNRSRMFTSKNEILLLRV